MYENNPEKKCKRIPVKKHSNSMIVVVLYILLAIIIGSSLAY